MHVSSEMDIGKRGECKEGLGRKDNGKADKQVREALWTLEASKKKNIFI